MFDGPRVSAMEEEDDDRIFYYSPDFTDRQKLYNEREYARRRPVRHQYVNRMFDQVSNRVNVIDEPDLEDIEVPEIRNENKIDIIKLQKGSEAIRRMYQYVKANEFPETKDLNNPELIGFVRAKSRFKIKNKLLIRMVGGREAVVLPAKMIDILFEEFHTKSGHLSPETVYRNVTEKYYAFVSDPSNGFSV